MKKALLISCLAGTAAFAAPAIQLPAEWTIQLESTPGYALVDTTTGELRTITFPEKEDFNPFESPIRHTGIEGVSHLSTGAFDLESSAELLAISSSTGNRTALFDALTRRETSYLTPFPEPFGILPFSGQIYGASHLSEGRSQFFIQPDPTKSTVSLANETLRILALQPYRYRDTDHAVVSIADFKKGGETSAQLFLNTPDDKSAAITALGAIDLDARLVTELTTQDGVPVLLAYVPGANTISIVSMPFDDASTAINTSDSIPFPLGSIIPIPPDVKGAEGDILLVSADGGAAAEAVIEDPKTITIIRAIPEGKDAAFTALLPIPGYGLLALTSTDPSRRSTGWTTYVEDGGNWQPETSGQLAPAGAGANDFATLFWFDRSPLTSSAARLLEIEPAAEWTAKPFKSDLPAMVDGYDFISSAQGLQLGSSVPTPTPAGANFLVTNQVGSALSVSAISAGRAIERIGLRVAPDSGSYAQPVALLADTSITDADIYFRVSGTPGGFRPFTSYTVGWSATVDFYAQDTATGLRSPIVSRTYEFDPAVAKHFDSDGDEVPDFVEMQRGLDPAGGADSDGDFQSDLDEILGGSDPNDVSDKLNVPETGRVSLGCNAGTEYAGLPSDSKGFTSAVGTPLALYTLTGELLGSSPVRRHPAPYNFPENLAAIISTSAPVDPREWVTAITPGRFALSVFGNDQELGHEAAHVLQAPRRTAAEPRFTVPDGATLEEAVAAWTQPALIAHAEAVAAPLPIDKILPIDTLYAAIVELEISFQLRALPAHLLERYQITPFTITDQFTLFPHRDTTRRGLTPDMIAALRANGVNFEGILAVLRRDRLPLDDPNLTPGTAALHVFANAVYEYRQNNIAKQPELFQPLDVFRIMAIAGAPIDFVNGTPRDTPYGNLDAAIYEPAGQEIIRLQNEIRGTKRQRQTWTVQVSGRAATGRYELAIIAKDGVPSTGKPALAHLMDEFREPFEIDQGLGLPIGAQLQITGFPTPAPAPFEGFDGMEVTAVAAFSFAPSTRDTDADLLDDSWEELFFGDLTTVAGTDRHPKTNHTYLQYQTEGANPRAGDLEAAIFEPTAVAAAIIEENGQLYITFPFPDSALTEVDITLSSASSLSGAFAPFAPQPSLENTGPDKYRFALPMNATAPGKNFFVVTVALTN